MGASDVMKMLYDAGTWANVQVDDAQKGNSEKERVKRQYDTIGETNVLTPGALTQLRDMALACGLIAVSDLRLNGDGSKEAQDWLKKSIDPKPHVVNKQLWRASYDLCWATARYLCFKELGDKAGRQEEKESWRKAASTCFGKKFTTYQVDEIFMSYELARESVQGR